MMMRLGFDEQQMGLWCGLAVAATLSVPALGQVGQTPQPVQQNVPAPAPSYPDIPEVPAISSPVPATTSTDAGTPPVEPVRLEPTGLEAGHFFGPYRRPKVPELFPGSSERLRGLVRDGKLYLSARDAVTLAIENNLDVEVERYNLVLSDTDQRRAAGGGSLRGIDFTSWRPPLPMRSRRGQACGRM